MSESYCVRCGLAFSPNESEIVCWTCSVYRPALRTSSIAHDSAKAIDRRRMRLGVSHRGKRK